MTVSPLLGRLISPRAITVSLVLGPLLFILLFFWLYGDKLRNGRAHGEQLDQLSIALKAQSDADLMAITMPYRQRSWKDTTGSVEKLRQRVTAVAFGIGFSPRHASHENFSEAFWEIDADDTNFRDDIHLSSVGTDRLGALVLEDLRYHFASNGTRYPSKIVIAGDCFSEDLVSGLVSHDPETEYVAVRSYGNPNQAIELVFKFGDTYLEGTDLVIWLRPEIFMTYREPPSLDLKPLVSGESSQQEQLSVVTDVGYNKYNFHEIVPRLEYPDAVVEIDADSPEHGRVVLRGYGAIKHERTGFEGIRAGDKIVATIQPLESYWAENPEHSSAYVFRSSDDPIAPRFWVHEWAKTDFTGEKAVSKIGQED